METPSSTRRVTRSQSQALAASINNSSSNNNILVSRKIEDSEKNLSKLKQLRNGQQEDRSALIDITNDSPIVGLATGSNLETPSSSIAKQRGSRVKRTPGSGEALLRGQVKTLLQKVEEEAELSKLSLEDRPYLQLVNSPMGLVAPTPANTPQIPNLSALASVTPSPIVQDLLVVSQVLNQMFDRKDQEKPESEESLIIRSLLLDFSEKFEVSDESSECSSELTYQEVVQGGDTGSCYTEKPSASTEDNDHASIWSLQVNASTNDDDDKEVAEEEEYDDEGLLLDELCEGLSKISVHTRFIYNSDDELVEEQEEQNCSQTTSSCSSNILRLKGLPTPKGKHLRFSKE